VVFERREPIFGALPGKAVQSQDMIGMPFHWHYSVEHKARCNAATLVQAP
jgi:hypothetical protein